MHENVSDIVRRAARHLPTPCEHGLELGAFDLNGHARSILPGSVRWTRIDARPGPGVDVVALAHEAPEREGGWDLVLSTEMLEHDPYWRESLARMSSVLRPGGLLVLTWASPNRPPHEPDASPIPGHYHAPSFDEVCCLLWTCCDWSLVDGGLSRQDLDCGLWGVKR